MSDAWLESLKLGDEAMVTTDGECCILTKIGRMTKTQIITAGRGWRFRKADGRSIGTQTYHHRYLVEPTPDRREAIERQRALLMVTQIRWRDYDLATLEAVLKLAGTMGQ